jgi:hypothetical protein
VGIVTQEEMLGQNDLTRKSAGVKGAVCMCSTATGGAVTTTEEMMPQGRWFVFCFALPSFSIAWYDEPAIDR